MALILAPRVSQAVDFTWNGLGGNVNWSTAANWGGTAPTSATTTNLIFAGSTNLGTLATPLNQNIANPLTLNSVTFNAGGGAFFLGGSPLNFTTGTSNSITQSSSSAQNIANVISATDNSTVTLTLGGSGSGVVTMSGNITAGSGSRDYAITKTGSSTFTLSGANDYGGLTTVSAGVLNIQNASALGATSAGTTVSTGAAVQIQGGIAVGAEALTLNGSGIANDGALRNISGTNSWTGAITLGSASTIGSDAGTLTLSGVVSGAFALTKVGAGTVTLNGTAANTYSGATLVNDGTLQLNKTSGNNAFAGTLTVGDGLGGSSSAVTRWLASTQVPTTTAVSVNSDGLLDLNNFSNTVGTLAMTGGSVTTGTGTLTLGGTVTGNAAATSATISGKLGLGANRTFTIADGAAAVDMDISAVVSGGFTLTKGGAGTMVLSGANNYTGTTTVSGGTLRLGANNAVPTASSVVVSSGGMLDNGGFVLAGNGTASLSVQNGGTLRLGGSTAFPTNYSSVTLGTTSTVEYAGTSPQTVALQNYGNLTVNNASGVTLAALAGPVTINGNLYLQSGLFSRNDGGFGTPVTIKGNITADAGATLGGEIRAFTFAGTTQNITLSGVTSSQDLGQMIVGTTTSNPTVTLQTNVNSSWGLTVGTATASTGAINLNGHTLTVGAGNVTVNSGGTFLNTTGLLNISGIFGIGTWTDNTGTQNFGAVGVTIPGTTVTLASNVRTTSLSVNGGTFSLGSFGLTTNSLILVDGATSGGTISASSAFDVRSGTISSVLTGAGALTKTTSGTVTLSGANTYTGSTTVSAGVLNIQNATGLGTTAAGTNVASGATLQLQNNLTVGAEALTISGTGASGQNGGLVNVSGTNNYGGLLTLGAAATISSDSGTLNLTNTGTITGATFGLTLTGAGNGAISSIIGTTTGTMTKSGSGTWTLSGANTYTGSTIVSAGTLQLNANNALGTTANGTTVANGAVLKLNGVDYSTAEALTLNGSGISNGGALVNTGTSTFAGAITAATDAMINAGGGILTLTGGIAKNGTTLTIAGGGTVNINNNGVTGSAANSDLVVDGTTVVLNTANSYNGPTTIQNSGTLKLGASNVLPSSPQTAMTVNTSSVFDLASFGDGVASLTGDSTATVKNSVIGGTSTLTVNPANGVSTTFAGVIAGTNSGAQGDMALIKSGAGTLVLSGVNTYTGATTINAGTMTLAASSGSALGSTSSITVNSGGTLSLGASDQINNSAGIALAGGTLAKGNFAEGTASSVGVGALTLTASGSIIDFGTGTVGVLSFASFSPGSYTLTIENWTGVLNTVGSASTDRLIVNADQTANLSVFNFTGYAGAVEFALGGGYYEIVPLTAVPEPGTYVTGVLTLTALGYQQRRRWRKRLSSVL